MFLDVKGWILGVAGSNLSIELQEWDLSFIQSNFTNSI